MLTNRSCNCEPLLASCLLAASFTGLAQAQKPIPLDYKGKPVHIGKTIVNHFSGDRAFFFRTGMSIDADGSPHAYHPVPGKGLDDLANAGKPGHWWALATRSGQPVLQGPKDPAPGYYVSTTSLMDTAFAETDPRRYVDAETIPFIVLPPLVQKAGSAKLGDFCIVYNTANGKVSPAIFADEGPANHLGEGSIAVAKALGIDADARRGGTDAGVVYLVFPGSGTGKPPAIGDLRRSATAMFTKWGGLDRLKTATSQVTH